MRGLRARTIGNCASPRCPACTCSPDRARTPGQSRSNRTPLHGPLYTVQERVGLARECDMRATAGVERRPNAALVQARLAHLPTAGSAVVCVTDCRLRAVAVSRPQQALAAVAM